ncbi:MAG: patatin family protein [Kofleriaceae bacterium]
MRLVNAIVVEGGAMRGIYAAGVLDVFLENDFHPFDLAIGASAGACNLASHLAGQHGRNRRCYTTQMSRAEFVDPRRFLRGGHWIDIDYLWDAFAREDPLDAKAATANRTRLVVAATSVETGEPVYLEPTSDTLIEVLRASSAVPVLFRKTVEIDGKRFVDGGVSAPIPVEEAYRRGARTILVIRSRPERFGGPSRLESALASIAFRKQPGLARAFRVYRDVYARSVAFLRRPPNGCTIIEVVPSRHLRTGRTTRDPRALAEDYAAGRAAGLRAMQRWPRRA